MTTAILKVESLERRDNPAPIGQSWADLTALTLSFAPDDTRIGTIKSDLFDIMKEAGSKVEWQREVLRAFQTWAVHTNANVAVVPDGGQAFGVGGEFQSDNRFGDIRIGARPLSADSLAHAVPADLSVGTWSGDLIFNSKQSFTIGPPAAGNRPDLFSVALHESGHVFGLDHSDRFESAMSATYGGVLSGPSASDLAELQSRYGVRSPDRYEGAAGNGNLSTATNLGHATFQSVTGDLTTVGDVDYFTFVVPGDSEKPVVQFRTAGVSSLEAGIAVFDANGRPLSTSGMTDPLASKTQTLRLPESKVEARYYVRVESSGRDVFAIGRYVLTLNLDSGKHAAEGKVVKDQGTNETPATAAPLPAWSNGSVNDNNSRFRVDASIENKNDRDVYSLRAPSFEARDAMQLELRNTKGDQAPPQLIVTDSLGNTLPVQVLESSGPKLTVQILGIQRGATYFVTVQSPPSADLGGDYRLSARFTEPASYGLTLLDRGTVSSALPESSGFMVVDSERLFQFSLLVPDTSFTDVTVELQVFDGNNKLVASWSVNRLTGRVDGGVYLKPGSYRLAVTLENRRNSITPGLAFWLFGGISSDPVGPMPSSTGTLPVPTTSPPPPQPTYTYTGSSTTIPIGYPYRS